MPDWISYLLVFALGAGAGAILAPRLSGLGGNAADREKKKTLSRLYKELPAFFDCLRADLNKPEGQFLIKVRNRTRFGNIAQTNNQDSHTAASNVRSN